MYVYIHNIDDWKFCLLYICLYIDIVNMCVTDGEYIYYVVIS